MDLHKVPDLTFNKEINHLPYVEYLSFFIIESDIQFFLSFHSIVYFLDIPRNNANTFFN